MTVDVLVVTQCALYQNGRMAGVHGSREQAVSAFAEIAGARSWSTERIDNVATMGERVLETARVLALYTIGEVPWTPAQQALIHERVRAGELAVVGVHSATDANHTWPEYGTIIGARFAGHPVSASLPLRIDDAEHPATQHLDGGWSLHDELYLFNERARWNSSALRGRIGLISDQSMLYRELSARENLEFFAKLYGLNNPTHRAARALGRLGPNAKGAVPALEQAAREGNADVRRAAREALQKVRGR